jgi:hypothetical protein
MARQHGVGAIWGRSPDAKAARRASSMAPGVVVGLGVSRVGGTSRGKGGRGSPLQPAGNQPWCVRRPVRCALCVMRCVLYSFLGPGVLYSRKFAGCFAFSLATASRTHSFLEPHRGHSPPLSSSSPSRTPPDPILPSLPSSTRSLLGRPCCELAAAATMSSDTESNNSSRASSSLPQVRHV